MSPPLPCPPEAILLATDLAARSDRARDRALQLARQWNARILALTVVPPAQGRASAGRMIPPPTWLRDETAEQSAMRQLEHDLDGTGVPVEPAVANGTPGPSAVHMARTGGCGLVVVGATADAWTQPPEPGTTGRWLARHSPVPTLVVHRRVDGPYRRIAVASDFSATSLKALGFAAACFDNSAITLVHGANAPAAGVLRGAPDRDTVMREMLRHARARAAAQLEQAQLQGRASVAIEPADPARLLNAWARAHDADLVVIGNHGRSTLRRALLGSVARQILEAAQVDVLVVPGGHH